MKMFKKTIIFILVMANVMSLMLMQSTLAKTSNIDLNSNYIVRSTKMNMESLPLGTIAESSIPSEFYSKKGNSEARQEVLGDDENKYIQYSGYNELKLKKEINNPYTFSLDVKCDSEANIGIFVRTSKNYKMIPTIYMSDLFEGDGAQGIGGSGIYVKPEVNQLKLFVKLFDESKPRRLTNGVHIFNVSCNFQTDFNNISFYDDGESGVSIYVENSLVATVEYSEPGSYDFATEKFYKKAVVKDANNKIITTYTNAIINTNSLVGIGDRNSTINYDNLKLDIYAPKPQSAPLNLTKSSEFVLHFDNLSGEFTNEMSPAGWMYSPFAVDKPVIVGTGEDRYLQFKGYATLRTVGVLEVPYTFSLDVQYSGPINPVGIFARSGTEQFRCRDTSGKYWLADFYEDDRSSNGYIGSSGFYLRPTNGNNLEIVLKQYQPDAFDTNPVANVKYSIATNVNFSTGRHKLTIKDTGDRIYIYVNEDLVAQITFANVKTYLMTVNETVNRQSEEYYSDITVYNGVGELLGGFTNGLISTKSKLCYANRNVTSQVDNFSVVTYTDKIPSEKASYKGSQIRTSLVPYKNKDGVIVESDQRQGLRFCFKSPEIGDNVTSEGKTYTVDNIGALVILKEKSQYLNITKDTLNPSLLKTNDLVDWYDGDVKYKSAYIYNIPEEKKDTVIVARLYYEARDTQGNIKVFYTDLQEKSVTDVYQSMVSAGNANDLDANVRTWWN